METVDRRSLGKGVAWSIPVIVVAAAVPAHAVSVRPELAVDGRVTFDTNWAQSGADGRYSYKLFSVTPGTRQPGRGYRVVGAQPSTQIGALSVTFYLPTPGPDTRFTVGPAGATGWSLMARDSTKVPKYVNGVYYYPFTTRYAANLPAESGTTYWPTFSFESDTNLTQRSRSYYVEQRTTIDGTAVEQGYGPISLA